MVRTTSSCDSSGGPITINNLIMQDEALLDLVDGVVFDANNIQTQDRAGIEVIASEFAATAATLSNTPTPGKGSPKPLMGSLKLNPSTFGVDAALSISPATVLLMGIGGTAPAAPGSVGEGFHATITADTITLDGSLQLQFLYDFEPQDGDTFEIITAATSLSGQFVDLPEGTLVSGFNDVGLYISYGPKSVTLTAEVIVGEGICDGECGGGEGEGGLDCPEGSAPNEAGTACLECPAGTYSPDGKACLPCPWWSVSTEPGAAACYFCECCLVENETQTACVLGEGECECDPDGPCPPGNYFSLEESDCIDCPPGTVQPLESAASCIPCAAGTVPNEGRTECVDCGPGTYSPNGRECLSCAPGTEPNEGGTGCDTCPPGTYSPDGKECLPCPAGSVSGEAGAAACILCNCCFGANEAQTACDVLGEGECEGCIAECIPGTYYSEDVFDCVDCPPGTVQPLDNAVSCVPCRDGTVPNETRTECVDCGPGTYSPNGRECLSCAPGTEPNEGGTGCDTCPPDGVECRPCPNYTIAPDAGSAICSFCSDGTNEAHTECEFGEGACDGECHVCWYGTYFNLLTGECLDCPPGTVTPGVDMTECIACAPGTEPNEQRDQCVNCPLGQYSPDGRDCLPCEANTFRDTVGAASCADCPPGTESTPGSFECTPIAEGEGEGSGPDGADAIAIRLLEEFTTWDLDEDGLLSRDEILARLLALLGDGKGVEGEGIEGEDAEANALFDELDKNNDDQLSVGELRQTAGVLSPVHAADQNGDGAVSLSELLRLIQFYNAGAYGCAENAGASEDGYEAGAGDASCLRHSSDYLPPEFEITLSELLRAIQFYNSGTIALCPEGAAEDSFCIE